MLTDTIENIARSIGCLPSEAEACIEELKRNKTADVTLRNGRVTLKSRMYAKEIRAKELNNLRVKKHRENQNVTPEKRLSVISNKKEVRKEEEKNGETPVAAIAAAQTDPVESRIWKDGVELLQRSGGMNGSARSFLGKLAKEHGKEKLAESIAVCQSANPADPKAYLIGVLQERATAGVRERARVGAHEMCPKCGSESCLGWLPSIECQTEAK